MGLLRTVWRWALALALNAMYFIVPWPAGLPHWASLLHWGLGALISVCLVGKLLYDTLFYDRFRP